VGITDISLEPNLVMETGKVATETPPARTATLLPDPPRADRFYTVISVDDHLVEPPDTFTGRVPAKLAERAPRIVDTEDGGQAWLYDDVLMPNVGFNAVVGRPAAERSFDPTRFTEMRKGAWDPLARCGDMDLAGVYASVCFPSFVSGFGGGRLQTITKDLELAYASVRAWNDWHLEAWAGAAPDRLIPCQIPWLHDPVLAAEEVRRNAARGFKAITLPEAPHKFGFPSINTTHWDPLIEACAETETVVCVHTGSGGTSFVSSTPGSPSGVRSMLFGVYGMLNAIDWLFAGYAAKFPTLKLCMSEGGIGWVPGVMDRAAHVMELHAFYGTQLADWPTMERSPVECLKQNFWFCFLYDPTTLPARHAIGIDRLLFEVDYPHNDSNWPDTQAHLERQLRGIPTEDVARLTWQNASELFRHPVPEAVQRDPNAF
jgi:predicted TIM-barrel fold metal-dependent hydrolase